MSIPIYKNWRSLIRPKFIEIDKESRTDSYAKFIAKPLESGFGITLGNALRRILLSSLQGAAITSVKIDGVQHEFSTIPGVKEDVVNITVTYPDREEEMSVEPADDTTLIDIRL